MFKKLVRDGKVAVVHSYDFGAGWSTWCYDREQAAGLVFDADIAEKVLAGDEDGAKDVARLKYPAAFVSGQTLRVAWVPEGEVFDVTEYDGAESVLWARRQYTA